MYNIVFTYKETTIAGYMNRIYGELYPAPHRHTASD